MFIRRITILCLVLWQLSHAGLAIGETTDDYLPLSDSNYWVYSVTATGGSFTVTIRVLPGFTTINNVQTKALQSTGGPDDGVEYWTNDINGIRMHGAYVPHTDIGPGRVYFEPPVVYARNTMTINETVKSSGIARFVFDNVGEFILKYASTSTLEKFESVLVPAGRFNAVKVNDTLRIFGSIGTEPYDDTSTGSTWLAKYTGVIKDTYADADGSDVSVLTGTNVKPPPPQFMPFLLPLLVD